MGISKGKFQELVKVFVMKKTRKMTIHERVKWKLEHDPVTLADQHTAWVRWGVDARPYGKRGKKP